MIGQSPNLGARKLADRVFAGVTMAAAILAVVILALLLFKLLGDGLPAISRQFITGFPTRRAEQAGILPAIAGSFVVMLLTFLFTVPIGVAAAVYLEELQLRRNRFTEFIQLNIANLAGVPSIVYGMLGLALWVPVVVAITRDEQAWRSLLTGGLTMSLLVLPMVILVSQEALKAVPRSFREGSLALGATRWYTVRKMVLPNALPGILTGIILAMSRAIGETAPLIVVGAVGFVNFMPKTLTDPYMVLPLQIFTWATDLKPEFHKLAAGAIVVLMAILLVLNSAAIWLRARAQSRRH